jgi:hypothetical protein
MPHEIRIVTRRFHGFLYASLLAGAQAWSGPALAEDRLFIYPAAGQSESQLADDRYACHLRAVGESGFDPTRAAMTSRPTETQIVQAIPPNRSQGAAGKGMVTGAVAGAVIGAATDNDAGQAAVTGAALGTLIGHSIERKGAEAAESQARAEGEKKLEESEARAAKIAERRAHYRSALSQCLVMRGYSVR